MVSEPPSSILRAAPEELLGRVERGWIQSADRVRPEGSPPGYRRAHRRVSESSRWRDVRPPPTCDLAPCRA